MKRNDSMDLMSATNKKLVIEIGKMAGSILQTPRTKLKGDYRTTWGVKTAEGLGRTILAIIAEAKQRTQEKNNDTK